MKKKICIFLLVIVLLMNLTYNTFATDLNTKLEVLQSASEEKKLDNDQGFISKTITESNPDTGEVTIELKLANTKSVSEENDITEIFLVVDNSASMDFVTASGQTRKEIVLNSASKLVESLFNISSNVKIGLIDFHGNSLFEGPGIWNAIVRQRLTNEKEKVLESIDKELQLSTSGGTNIEAGLRTALKNFSSENNHKVVILLTDGIPTNDTSGNSPSNDVTTEKSILIQENTKKAIQELKSSGVYVISMLTGLSESDGNTDKSGKVYENNNTIEESLAAAERVFGTQENPTADKYYLVNSADIDNIINKDIFQDISKRINNSMNSIKIVDYFPNDVMDNFDFAYVGDANTGTKTDVIDPATKTITWNIDTLKSGEEAVLKYKLKIRDMKNESLLNKTVATNEKVVLTYNDIQANKHTIELTSSPKIRLTEIKEEKNDDVNNNQIDTTTNTTNISNTSNDSNNSKTTNVSNTANNTTKAKDTTIAKQTIPKTGTDIINICVIISITTVFTTIAYKKVREFKNI